jgi:hypothetical protein
MRSVTWFRWFGLLSIALGVSAPLVAQKGVEGKITHPSPKAGEGSFLGIIVACMGWQRTMWNH